VKKTMLKILGMRCNSCREELVHALSAVMGVRDVEVSLIRAEATVLHAGNCTDEMLLQAVHGAGYSATINAVGGQVASASPPGAVPLARAGVNHA
jgi:copper chaperone CopZ